jgi:hypothetical protein
LQTIGLLKRYKKCEPKDEELKLLTQKLSPSSLKYGVGSGIHNKKFIPDSGVKKAPDPGSAPLVTNKPFVRLPCSPISVLEFLNNLWGLGTE